MKDIEHFHCKYCSKLTDRKVQKGIFYFMYKGHCKFSCYLKDNEESNLISGILATLTGIVLTILYSLISLLIEGLYEEVQIFILGILITTISALLIIGNTRIFFGILGWIFIHREGFRVSSEKSQKRATRILIERIIFAVGMLIFIIGMLSESILAILNIILALTIYWRIKKPEVKEIRKESWFGNIKESFSVRGFNILFVTALIWLIVFIFNLTTFPEIGPLYSIRETFLIELHPEVAIADLPGKSTFSYFGLAMDIVLLLLFWIIIYIKWKPGLQPLEEMINFILGRTIFIVVLCLSSLYHLSGHLPIELYARGGQWGDLPLTDIKAWIGFDKVAHLFGSIAITMFIAAIVTEYLAILNLRNKDAPKFTLIISVCVFVTLGLMWEFFEWVFALVIDLHFVDEVLDSPKDLVYDFIGALIGGGLSYYDLKDLSSMQEISNSNIL